MQKNTENASIKWNYNTKKTIENFEGKVENVGNHRSKVSADDNPIGMKISQRVVRTYIDHCNDVRVLTSIIRTFPGVLYTKNAKSMIALVESSSSSSAVEYTHTENRRSERTDSMFRSMNFSSKEKEKFNICNGRTDALTELGLQLTLYPPPLTDRRNVLRDVWVVVGCTDSLDAYVRCVGAWMGFAKCHCRYIRAISISFDDFFLMVFNDCFFL